MKQIYGQNLCLNKTSFSLTCSQTLVLVLIQGGKAKKKKIKMKKIMIKIKMKIMKKIKVMSPKRAPEGHPAPA